MPKKLSQSIKEAKTLINQADSILLITGAGMSVESGIPTYRGNNGLWEKEIIINNIAYSYDEISSLKMWKKFPELAWGFKSKFYSILAETKPHSGYFKLLEKIKQKFNDNYFVCTSNIDGFFKKSGFDPEKIYEMHGTMDLFQCMDKSCNLRNGIQLLDKIPSYDENMMVKKLPKCKNCSNLLRPNVSMFGDDEFYQVPYKYQRNKLEKFISNANQMVILEIGCGINPHSLRMENGKMLSGEWKMPKIKKDTPYIRINPMEEKTPPNQVHIPLGATKGVISIF
jgi:NAD-dependent SIR2 family protein deacetylase